MSADDDLTTDLSRELHRRVETMHGSGLGLGDVRRRAHAIRRRRTTTAVLGAVAAIALMVPTAALATHSGHRIEPGPATQSPTPSQTTATAEGHQPAPGVLDVSDLPTGAPPAIPYLGRGSGEHPFEPFPATSFTQLQDGSDIVQVNDEGNFEVDVTSPDGTHTGPFGSHAGLAVNGSHTTAAWLDLRGQVMTWTVGDRAPRPLGDPVPGQDLRVAAVTGDDCSLACSVVVDVRDAQQRPWVVDRSGSHPLREGGYLDVNDTTSTGLTIGLTRITDVSTCSALLGKDHVQDFATCKSQLASFSPDGRLILGLPSYFDGPGPGGISMYDLAGTRLFERTSTEQAQSYFTSATWEDDTHVLAPTFQDGRWALVRIASDGSMEYAVAPAKGPYDSSPFVLSVGGGP
jgi:hypothetical protein